MSDRGRVLNLQMPPSARYSGSVRRRVLAFASQSGVRGRDLEEFIFALGEGLANAIEHSQSAAPIEVRCQLEDDKIVATIVDSGSGFEDEWYNATLPDPLAERGRGLPIMRSCTDIFSMRSEAGRGTAVVLGRYLRRNQEGEAFDDDLAS